MKNGYKLGLAAIAASISLVGCGGGSSNSATDIGTSFYIDNAVEGVHYKCGTQEGITDVNGKFTFDIGSSCAFFLDSIPLRTIEAGELVDGENFFEDNNATSSILIGLDLDGDPTNGITVNPVIVAALVDANITSLSDPETDIEEVKTIIVDNGGTYVTEEEAQTHLQETELITLLGGKTFYEVGEDSEIIAYLDRWVISDFTENEANSTWTELMNGSDLPADATGEDTLIISTNGQLVTKVQLVGQDGTFNLSYNRDASNDEYLAFDVNSTFQLKLYFELADAEAEYASLLPIPMTEAMLIGKTFYTDAGSDFEEISFISSTEVTFREVAIAQDGSIIFDTGANILPYTINSSGEVVITFSDGGTNTYQLLSMTDTQWDMTKNGDADSAYSTWLLSAPTNFPEPDPTEAALLREMLAGNTWSSIDTTLIFNAAVTSIEFGDGGTDTVSLDGMTLTHSEGYEVITIVNETTLSFSSNGVEASETFTLVTAPTTPTTTAADLKALLSDKTLYNASLYEAWTFDTDVTSLYYVDIDAINVGSGNSGTETIAVLSGSQINLNGTIVDVEIFDQYITISLGSTTEELWFDQAEMEAAHPELLLF